MENLYPNLCTKYLDACRLHWIWHISYWVSAWCSVSGVRNGIVISSAKENTWDMIRTLCGVSSYICWGMLMYMLLDAMVIYMLVYLDCNICYYNSYPVIPTHCASLSALPVFRRSEQASWRSNLQHVILYVYNEKEITSPPPHTTKY